MELKNKSMALCVIDGDFLTAYAHYTKATARWKEKWYDTCKVIYDTTKKGNIKKSFVFDEDGGITKRKRTKLTAKYNEEPQIYYNGCEPLDTKGKDNELLYVIVMRDSEHRAIYYKVGTTTRAVEKRMTEHLDYYVLEDIKYIEINRVADCGKLPAEGLESYLRAKLIKEHPTAFKKNDRFIAEEVVNLDLEKIDKWIAEYLG